jgi:hypothetical protein
MLGRISHEKLGLGVCLDEFRTEGGKPAVRAVFDASPNDERIVLAEFVQPSTARMPQSSKKAAKRKTRQAKSEPVSDELLVAVPDAYMDEGSEEPESVKATSQEP